MMWKDTLLPGASRTPVAVGTPGSVADYYGTPTGRMDFVMGPNGTPVISGSSEAQPGAGGSDPSWSPTPSPGFLPVDPGQYGNNPFFAGRGSLSGAASGVGGVLGQYGSKSVELQALLKALASLDPAALSGALGGGGLKIAE
jgi:hypothetical protein